MREWAVAGLSLRSHSERFNPQDKAVSTILKYALLFSESVVLVVALPCFAY